MKTLDTLDQQLFELTKKRPVALTFTSERPSTLDRVPAPPPSGCAFWKLAEMGRAFYAEVSDHFGCPVGAYVLGADLPETQLSTLRDQMNRSTPIISPSWRAVPGATSSPLE